MAKLRRWPGGSAAAPAGGMEDIRDLQLIDVSLVARTEMGLVEVPGLELALDANGLTVRRQTGEEVCTIPWMILRRFDSELHRDDRPGVARRVDLGVESDRRRHEFLVQHVEPLALSGALSALSSRYAGSDLLASGAGRRRRG